MKFKAKYSLDNVTKYIEIEARCKNHAKVKFKAWNEEKGSKARLLRIK